MKIQLLRKFLEGGTRKFVVTTPGHSRWRHAYVCGPLVNLSSIKPLMKRVNIRGERGPDIFVYGANDETPRAGVWYAVCLISSGVMRHFFDMVDWPSWASLWEHIGDGNNDCGWHIRPDDPSQAFLPYLVRPESFIGTFGEVFAECKEEREKERKNQLWTTNAERVHLSPSINMADQKVRSEAVDEARAKNQAKRNAEIEANFEKVYELVQSRFGVQLAKPDLTPTQIGYRRSNMVRVPLSVMNTLLSLESYLGVPDETKP